MGDDGFYDDFDDDDDELFPAGSRMAPEVPSTFRPLVERFGDAVGVEQARAAWAALTQAVQQDGVIALITRERWEWAALVPLAEVAEPLDTLPSWSLTDARPQLGDLVRLACAWPGQAVPGGRPGPQLLTRHRRPVAAVIDARVLVGRPEPGARLAVTELLEGGCTVVVGMDWGESGSTTPDGDVESEPTPDFLVALAVDQDGRVQAAGSVQGGPDQLNEALLSLTAVSARQRPYLQDHARRLARGLLTRHDRPAPPAPAPLLSGDLPTAVDPAADPWQTPPADPPAHHDGLPPL